MCAKSDQKMENKNKEVVERKVDTEVAKMLKIRKGGEWMRVLNGNLKGRREDESKH